VARAMAGRGRNSFDAGNSSDAGRPSGDLSRRLVDAVISDFPDHRLGTRPVHTIGIGATGYFEGSDVAPRYSVAEQFAGARVPATVRFSNGSGSPVERDNVLDARGMATKFHLSEDRAADLVMMTLPVFFVPTPEEFLDFAAASRPEVIHAQPWWSKVVDKLALRSPAPAADKGSNTSGLPGMLRYARDHAFADASVIFMSSLVTPTSYARVKYHAVHTFRATGSDGIVRFVRLSWEPVAGVRPVSEDDADELPADYLRTELGERLADQPARFLLRMDIAGQGDVVDDPTAIWDSTQARVLMGELVITDLVDDQEAGCEHLSFNPTRVAPGLECSDDPVLAARRGAYEESCRRRGASGCPVAGGAP
jgi:catalase